VRVRAMGAEEDDTGSGLADEDPAALAAAAATIKVARRCTSTPRSPWAHPG
jgi:hypothetical protein